MGIEIDFSKNRKNKTKLQTNICKKCGALMIGIPKQKGITWVCSDLTCNNTHFEHIKK